MSGNDGNQKETDSKFQDMINKLQLRINVLEMDNKDLQQSNSQLIKMIDDRDKTIEELELNDNEQKSQIQILKIQLEELCENESIKLISKQEKLNKPFKIPDSVQYANRKQSQQSNSSNNNQNKNKSNNNGVNRNVIQNPLQRQKRNSNNNNIVQNYNGQYQPDVDNMTYEQLLELESKIGKVNNGLATHKINSLNQVKYDSNKMMNIDKTCPICQEEYQEQEQLRLLNPCNHIHHSACVDKWLKSSKKCPVCFIEVTI